MRKETKKKSQKKKTKRKNKRKQNREKRNETKEKETKRKKLRNETKWKVQKPISVTPRKIYYTKGVIFKAKEMRKNANKDETTRFFSIEKDVEVFSLFSILHPNIFTFY